MSLSTTQYGYIVDPMVPFTDDKGKTIKNGFIRVFMAGTSTPVITYRNYDGATNQEKIELDNSGRVKHNVIGSKGSLYKVVVYNILHSQENPLLTVDKIAVLGASVTGTTVVTGLDSVTVQEENFINATVEGTGVELALDPTEVTSEVSTIGAAETAAPDYVVPLLDKTGTGDSKKISLANLFKFALDWISRLTTTVTSFASGDFIAVSNTTDGTAKMSKDTLLELTAQNALAGNVAPAFVPSDKPNPTTTIALHPYVYNGSLYVAKEAYQGVWNPDKFFEKDVVEYIEECSNIVGNIVKSSVVSGNAVRLSLPMKIHPGDKILFKVDAPNGIVSYNHMNVFLRINGVTAQTITSASTTFGDWYEITATADADEFYAGRDIALDSGDMKLSVFIESALYEYVQHNLDTLKQDQVWMEAYSDVEGNLILNGEDKVKPSIAVDGACVTSSGSVSSNENYCITDSITLLAGQTIAFFATGYYDAVAIVSIYNGSTYTRVVRSVDSTHRFYEYTNNTNGSVNVRLCSRKTDVPLVAVRGTKIVYDGIATDVNTLKEKEKILENEIFENPSTTSTPQVAVDGYFVQENSAVVSNEDYCITESIALSAGQTIAFFAKGYNQNVAIVSLYDNNTYTRVVRSVDSTYRFYEYTNNSSDSVNVRLSYRYGGEPKVVMLGTKRGDVDDETLPMLSMFETIGVIGDSFASGELYTKEGVLIGDIYAKSWPQIMGRNNGIDVTNYTFGGANTKNWQTEAHGYPLMSADTAKEIYLIALAKNDSNNFGIEGLGTIDDVHVGSPELNADTFYGRYARIIEQVKAHAPLAKIVCYQDEVNSTAPRIAYNTAIENIAELYEIPYIVTSKDSYFESDIFNEKYGYHPTFIGYSCMATAMASLLQRCIVEYKDYFKTT